MAFWASVGNTAASHVWNNYLYVCIFNTHKGPVVSLLLKVSRKNALQARRAFLRETLSSKEFETTGPLCVLTCSRFLSSTFSDKKIDFLFVLLKRNGKACMLHAHLWSNQTFECKVSLHELIEFNLHLERSWQWYLMKTFFFSWGNVSRQMPKSQMSWKTLEKSRLEPYGTTRQAIHFVVSANRPSSIRTEDPTSANYAHVLTDRSVFLRMFISTSSVVSRVDWIACT